MKKVIMTIAVVVVLLGISEKAQAQAGPWTGRAFDLGASHRSVFGLVRSHRLSLRPVLGRSSLTRSAFGLGSSYRYGRYSRYGYGGDRTLRRVTGYGRLALGALQVLNQNSIGRRVVRMAEKEQNFRHGQHRIIRGRSNTVLRTTVPVRRIIKIKPKKVQAQKSQEIQQLQQQIKEMQIQLEKLQQQVGK